MSEGKRKAAEEPAQKDIPTATSKTRLLFYITLVVALILTVASYFKKDGFRDAIRIDERIREEEFTRDRLKNENEMLRKKLKTAQEDPYYVEKFAREKLNMVKDGDLVFRFYDDRKDKK